MKPKCDTYAKRGVFQGSSPCVNVNYYVEAIEKKIVQFGKKRQKVFELAGFLTQRHKNQHEAQPSHISVWNAIPEKKHGSNVYSFEKIYVSFSLKKILIHFPKKGN